MITKQNALGNLVTYNEPMFILVKGSDIYEGPVTYLITDVRIDIGKEGF